MKIAFRADGSKEKGMGHLKLFFIALMERADFDG